MLVHVIFEDLQALNDLPSHVHTAGFVDRGDAAHYLSVYTEQVIREMENPRLRCEYNESKVSLFHNNMWVGCLEIREVDVQ
jgi:hypothetical protein